MESALFAAAAHRLPAGGGNAAECAAVRGKWRRLTWLVLHTNTRVGTALLSRIVQYDAHVDTSNNCPRS